ncbi:hypothetical protein BH09MYX1_BH09MYX1_18880 [soil metagenome]
MQLRELLFDRRGRPLLVGPGIIALLVSLALTLLALRVFEPPKSAEERAAALLASGKLGEGEEAAAQLVREQPTVPHVLFLIDAHRLTGKYVDPKKKYEERQQMIPVASQHGMSDAEIDALL